MSDFLNCSICTAYRGLSRLTFIDKIMLDLCYVVLVSFGIVTLNYIMKTTLTKILLTYGIMLKFKKFPQAIAVFVAVVALPVITVLITIAMFYKTICSIAIRRKDKRFVKFLDIFDVFWCLEDNNTTDVHGVIKSTTLELALDKVNEKLINVFINNRRDKMFYRKSEDYGIYYWRRYSCIDLAQYVQIGDLPSNITSDEENMEIVNDEGLFKVLLLKNVDVHHVGDTTYDVVIKFHKSVRDDAVVEFLGHFKDKGDDWDISFKLLTDSKDYDSPEALISMITDLFNVLKNAFNEELRKRNVNEITNIKMKILNWIQSETYLIGVNDKK